jgi:hypothetical protein
MEYINVHRTFFVENFFFPLFIGGCGLFCCAMKNAMKINFAVALSHSTFASENLKCFAFQFCKCSLTLLLHSHIAYHMHAHIHTPEHFFLHYKGRLKGGDVKETFLL